MSERTLTYLPLAALESDPKNPKAHAAQVIDDSIGRFGYIDSIVRDERTGFIISGHGRTQALRHAEARGDKPPDGIRVDEDGVWQVPVLTGWASRSDAEARAALIALNQTTVLGGWDERALLDLLTDLEGQEDGLLGVGFDDDDLADLRERLADLEEEEPEDRTGRSTLLDIADLSLGDPTYDVHHGQRWAVGRHWLVIANPHNDVALFRDLLADDEVFLAPYPDVWLTVTDLAKERTLVMIQPDLFLAGHLLDKHASLFGADEVALA